MDKKVKSLVLTEDILTEVSQEQELPYEIVEDIYNTFLSTLEEVMMEKDTFSIKMPEMGHFVFNRHRGKGYQYDPRYRELPYHEIHKDKMETIYARIQRTKAIRKENPGYGVRDLHNTIVPEIRANQVFIKHLKETRPFLGFYNYDSDRDIVLKDIEKRQNREVNEKIKNN